MSMHHLKGGSKPLMFKTSLLACAIALAGCNDDSVGTTNNSNAVTNPIPEYEDQIQVSGVIQGVLRDGVTGQPIPNAVIDIGHTTATTNSRGQYVLENVPVTDAHTSDAVDIDAGETYKATIDLTATNAGRSAEEYRYRDFIYTDFDVKFGTFTREEASEAEGQNLSRGTFHQPISGLVSAFDVAVNKMSTAVEGVVYMDTNQFGQQANSPLAGATVKLGHTDGNSITHIDSVTASSEGRYRFEGVEAGGTDLVIEAYSADGEYYGLDVYESAFTDGETLDLTRLDPSPNAIQTSPALMVSLLELSGPILTSVLPEQNSDLDPTAFDIDNPLEVTFTFNRPIADNNYANALDASSSANGGLWADVDVQFLGSKAGNVPHSLSWSDDRRTLTVALPYLGASSRYSVDISAAGDLIDSMGRNVELAANAGNANASVEFTTRGGATAAAPEPTIVNQASIDADSGVVLNWAPVSGAKTYAVYRELVQVWDDRSNNHGFERIGTTGESRFSDTPQDTFVENNAVQLQYNYRVAAINSDGLESPWSDMVTATDVISPRLVGGNTIDTLENDEVTINFSEPVVTAQAEDVANYSVSNLLDNDVVLESVEYDVQNASATLFFDQPLQPNLDTTAAVNQWARVRLGWNRVLLTDVPDAEDAVGGNFSNEYTVASNVTIEEFPAGLSTGWCAHSDENGEFSSLNSENYPDNNFNVVALTPSGNDQVVQTLESDRVVILTGDNGICNSLQDWAGDLNVTEWPIAGTAELGDWAVVQTAIEGALISGAGVNSNVDFRLADRTETLNQLAELNVFANEFTFDHFDADPVAAGRVSEWTVYEASSGDLGAEDVYYYVGERDGDTISNDPDATTAFAPGINNYAVRPALSSQNTTVYRVSPTLEDYLDPDNGANLNVSDGFTVGTMGETFLRTYLTATGIRDIAGNLIQDGTGGSLAGELTDGVVTDSSTDELVSTNQ